MDKCAYCEHVFDNRYHSRSSLLCDCLICRICVYKLFIGVADSAPVECLLCRRITSNCCRCKWIVDAVIHKCALHWKHFYFIGCETMDFDHEKIMLPLLTIAADVGNIIVCQALVSIGSISTDKLTSALIQAVQHGRRDVVIELLKTGADREAAMIYATSMLSNEMCAILLEAGVNSNYGMFVATAATIGSIINAGGNVMSIREIDGRTPLHVAKNEIVTAALIAAGAHIDATDLAGSTPLHIAAAAGLDGVCRVLITAGARIDIHDSNGHVAADLISVDGKEDLFIMLS